MRRMAWIGSVGLLAVATAIAAQATPPLPEPLCRRAPTLEVLPAEKAQVTVQQADVPRKGGRHDRDIIMPSPEPVPMVVEAPPPAPPMVGMPAPVVAPAAPIAAERAADSAAKVAPSRSEPEATAMPLPPGYREPPAGLLTAGDHDDLLNPLLYARYVWRAARNLGQTVAGLPNVDTSRVLTLNVEDSSGRPAPFVPVTVSCADGNSLTLKTLADGRVVLFPDLDRLGNRVTVTAGSARREVTIGSGPGGQAQTLVVGGSAKAPRKFDLMIALDTTGSMGDEIEFLKSELRAIVADLKRANPLLDIRIGVAAYKDIGDDYVTWTLPLTGNLDQVQARLGRLSGTGGGDMPEAMDQALIRATAQDWRPDAVHSMLLVADAPPHDELQGRAFRAAEAARARRIQIVPVASSGVDDRAEYFMRAVAALTQSRYIFLTDDSGIGNAHAEPDVDCYAVTSLASAIRRVLAGQVTGVRVEPNAGEVIRTVGTYDQGRCRLPADFRTDQ